MESSFLLMPGELVTDAAATEDHPRRHAFRRRQRDAWALQRSFQQSAVGIEFIGVDLRASAVSLGLRFLRHALTEDHDLAGRKIRKY
jgi:hypothetical protein